MADNVNRKLLRSIPKIDQIIASPLLKDPLDNSSREVVIDAVRRAVNDIRTDILEGETPDISVETIARAALDILSSTDRRSLRRVINGTGIILHTNLGRARLNARAAEQVTAVAMGYSTLEYDLKNGERGSRHDHINSLIREVTGAEDAIAVNNNAAATLLVLMALTYRKEVVVSRGELVEIGGSFRVPDIMKVGGTILREVGTTNKTHLYDYEKAINENTGALLKVHTSNYRIMGFTEDVEPARLVGLAHKHLMPMIYDLGSGLIPDLHDYGLDEPTVASALKAGADVVLFSGDKLLGGPQAGIIVGKKRYIDTIKSHPLARAMRLDKMTLAALEETFRIYRDPKQALEQIPVLSMITQPLDQVESKAEAFTRMLREANLQASFAKLDGVGRVGGGSAPMLNLKTWAVAVLPSDMSVDELAIRLRKWRVPIISHIQDGMLLLDMRTISDDEIEPVYMALVDILS